MRAASLVLSSSWVQMAAPTSNCFFSSLEIRGKLLVFFKFLSLWEHHQFLLGDNRELAQRRLKASNWWHAWGAVVLCYWRDVNDAIIIIALIKSYIIYDHTDYNSIVKVVKGESIYKAKSFRLFGTSLTWFMQVHPILTSFLGELKQKWQAEVGFSNTTLNCSGSYFPTSAPRASSWEWVPTAVWRSWRWTDCCAQAKGYTIRSCSGTTSAWRTLSKNSWRSVRWC